MAGRDIQIPFGPDKTGGLGFRQPDSEGEVRDPFAEPTDEAVAALDVEQPTARGEVSPDIHAVEQLPAEREDSPARRDEALSDEDAAEQGVDAFQMSVLALKDSIGQGRELKEREKEREQLAEALRADHVELADREDILANYHSLVAEQDAIIDQGTQQREGFKGELSQVTVALEQVQAELDALREQQAIDLQPIEADLGRARAAADQAKNDERSRKSELGAAESELRRADEAAANTVAVAQHEQSKAAYDEARARSEQAKEYLAQVQKAYDDARQRADQAAGPLERNAEELTRRAESLKDSINSLGEEISAARNRRQYCDTVFQYPDETAKMRSEVEQAEALARKMDVENRNLRKQLAESKKQARSAKIAIGIVIAVIVAFIITFIVVSGR